MRPLLLLAVLAAPALAAEVEPEPQKIVILAARDSEWASYRHAYGAAASFDVVLASRPLVQAHMQIKPREPGLSLEGLHIVLEGATTRVDIPVDRLGRATIPMLKKAYDEDAVLRLNRMKGSFRFSGRFTLRERADGVYSAANLRAGCEQLLSAQKESGNLLRLWGKKCAGVNFIYPASDLDAAIVVQSGAPRTVAAVDASIFDLPAMGLYKVATYRFADFPAEGNVLARQPLAISVVYQ